MVLQQQLSLFLYVKYRLLERQRILLQNSLHCNALYIFGEILKKVGKNAKLRPKPHLYLSMMRSIALQGDYDLVKNLHKQIWPDSTGIILLVAQEEANHLFMEAALNAGQRKNLAENRCSVNMYT
ncbi:hypothetical protein AHAS_Ahas10G0127700 [Arachis hypogaea]